MKKIVTTSTTGGAPIYLDDFKDVFNDEIWDAMQGLLLSSYETDTEGIIVQGCNVGGSGPSSYSISGGIVFIDGEFRRLTAATGLSLPQYIKAATDSNTSRTFEDTTIKTLFVTKSADLQTTVPVSGQYVAITTTTDPDDRRLLSEVKGKWVTVSGLSAGWSGTIEYRREKSGRIDFRGSVHATAPTATATIASAGAVPNSTNDTRFVIHVNSSINEYTAILQISTLGAIVIDQNFVSDSDYYFSGVTYFT